MPDLLTPERIEEIRERLKKRGLRNFYTHVYADAQVVDAIDDLAALLAHIAAQRERIERLERILAAEQGREGLEGWRWAGACWERIVFGPKRLGPPSPLARAWPGGRLWTRHDNWLRGAGHDCLEAMEAAEAALRGEK